MSISRRSVAWLGIAISGLAAVMLVTGSTSIAALQADQAELMMQAARNKQIVEGKLDEAIKIYREVLARYEQNRPVAARALVALGQCYEKLGAAQIGEARKAYERIVQQYPEQADPVAQARARLTALSPAVGTPGRPVLSVRRFCTAMDITGKVSPDGRFVSFTDWSTGGNLAVRDVASCEVRRLTDTATLGATYAYAEYSVPSPDGRNVAYAWAEPKNYDLRVIGLDGSKPRVLRTSGSEIVRQFPVAWSPDGRRLLAEFVKGDGTRDMMLVDVADGSTTLLKALGKAASPGGAFSPDGRYIAWATPDGLSLFDVRAAREIPLIPDRSKHSVLGWAPDGEYILFSSERSGSADAWLIAVSEGKATGEPVFVKKNWGFLPMGFTRSGSFYYAVNNNIGEILVVEIDPVTGATLSQPRPASPRGNTWAPDWSPDGRSLAFLLGRDPGWSVVVRSLDNGDEREFQLGERTIEMGASVRWFPDGRAVAVAANEPGKGQSLVRIDVKTGLVTHLMPLPPNAGFPRFSISRDGNSVVYMRGIPRPGGAARIVARDLKTGDEIDVLERPGLYADSVSPDGRWRMMAVLDGKFQILFVAPVGAGEPREIVRIDSEKEIIFGGSPWWTPDGRYIQFLRGVKGKTLRWELWRVAAGGGEPERLGLTLSGQLMAGLRPHPDGRRLAASTVKVNLEVWVMENLLPRRGTVP